MHAIPTTPLYDRLKKEGRLNDKDDSAAFGTNVAPLGMSREELRKGFVEVTREAYTADAYFRRIDALFVDGGFKFAAHQFPIGGNIGGPGRKSAQKITSSSSSSGDV